MEQMKRHWFVLLVAVIQLRMKNKTKKLVNRQIDKHSMKKRQPLIALFAVNQITKETQNCVE